MKKKLVFILLSLSVLLNVTFITIKLFSNSDIDDGFNDLSQVKHEDMLSMMLEQTVGAGDYSLETRSSWPTKEEGYVFNSTLSKCEKGSKLRWDDINNVVVMVGTTSDKCYAYFDVYVEPSITLANWVKSQYTGIQGENNLYYHDSTLENGAGDKSYRYAGASDTTNNFVCFGIDEATCPDDNLYRIIGVFGDQVKLIKWDYSTATLLGTDGAYVYTYSEAGNGGTTKGSNAITLIGGYYWNGGTSPNTWSASNLNTTNLNTNYINNMESSWTNKIAETVWKVGGNTYANIVSVTAATAYANEYTNPAENTTVSAKIGLMYTSDYGFAASSSAWTTTLYNYNSSSITSVNWMYMGLSEWTIMRRSGTTDLIFFLGSDGYIDRGSPKIDEATSKRVAYAVRPTFYLNSDVIKVGNNIGSKTDPIRID